MTDQQKDLIWLLLQEDHYLVKTKNARGKEVYKVLEGRQIPVQYFTEADVKKVKDVLKSDSKKRMTLNLSAVRQLHGKNYVKMLYKKKHQIISLSASKPEIA
ncbi:MAG: hypothetical protein ABJA71_02075 [Ginsengibacter sp.]